MNERAWDGYAWIQYAGDEVSHAFRRDTSRAACGYRSEYGGAIGGPFPEFDWLEAPPCQMCLIKTEEKTMESTNIGIEITAGKPARQPRTPKGVEKTPANGTRSLTPQPTTPRSEQRQRGHEATSPEGIYTKWGVTRTRLEAADPATYERCMDALAPMGHDVHNRAFVMERIDEIDELAQLATELHRAAKEDEARHFEKTESVLDGIRGKTRNDPSFKARVGRVSKENVEAELANNPQAREIMEQRRQLHHAVRMTEALATRLDNRRRTLDSIMRALGNG